jgi:hypothetical protein
VLNALEARLGTLDRRGQEPSQPRGLGPGLTQQARRRLRHADPRPFAAAGLGYISAAMERNAAERSRMIEFLGGPWDRRLCLYDHDPHEVIEAPLELPFRYRRAVKLGTGQSDRPVHHLIYELIYKA